MPKPSAGTTKPWNRLPPGHAVVTHNVGVFFTAYAVARLHGHLFAELACFLLGGLLMTHGLSSAINAATNRSQEEGMR